MRGRARLVAGAVGAGCAVLAVAVATAAAAGTPIPADQLHLDASGPAQFSCIETGPRSSSGCGEGTPESGTATLTLSAGPDGGGVVTVHFNLNGSQVTVPISRFSVVTDGAGGVQLTAPAVPGTVAFSALTLTGSATNLAGTMTFVNNSSHVNGSVAFRLALAGTGLTVVPPPSASASASASASPSPRGSATGAPAGAGSSTLPILVAVVAAAAALAALAAWLVRSQAGGGGGAAPSGGDPVASLVKLQPSIDQVITELTATGSSSLATLAQQLRGVQGQIDLLGAGGAANAGPGSVAGLQSAIGGVQVPPPGYAAGVQPAAEAQALQHAQQVLDSLLQPLYQLQQQAGPGGQQQQSAAQPGDAQAGSETTSSVNDEAQP